MNWSRNRRVGLFGALLLHLVVFFAGGTPPQRRWITVEPTENTIEILRQNECWAIAAIACDWVRVSAQGTRSQAMSFRARVLAASDERLASPIEIDQYVADDAILTPDESYLVILMCDVAFDGSHTWKVVQRQPLEGAEPSASVVQTERAVSDGLGRSPWFRVSLALASLRDEPLPAEGPGFAPAVRLPAADSTVQLLIGETMVDAILRAPTRLLPPSPVEVRELALRRRQPLPAGSKFIMYYNGEFAAMGTVIDED